MKWFHIHSDSNYQLRNVHYLYQCRCGARRSRRAFANLDGPVAAGWPEPRDRHGMPMNDSGWVSKP